jgi:hypothetical protein
VQRVRILLEADHLAAARLRISAMFFDSVDGVFIYGDP